MGKKCVACGIEMDDSAVFCQSCGQKQIVEKGKDDKGENDKKKIVGCILVVAIMGFAFIRGFSWSNVLYGSFGIDICTGLFYSSACEV